MSVETNDEKRTNADVSSVSQPIAKPHVSRLPSLSTEKSYIESEPIVKAKADEILSTINELDIIQSKNVLRIVSNFVFKVGEQKLTGVKLV